MKVTGIVASPRRIGNSDILVKETLKGLQEQGLEVSILRLRDFRIEYCNGCEKCVVQENPRCPIKDDVKFIYEQIMQSDGLVLGSPIYIHGIPGILKTLIDRIRPYVSKGESIGKKFSGFLFTHTFNSEFEYAYALPYLLFFSFYLNFQVSGILSVPSGSPGECLIDVENIRKVRVLSEKLFRNIIDPAGPVTDFQEKQETTGQETIICPGCHNLTFSMKQGKIICPVCKEEGILAGDSVDWQKKSQFSNLKETMNSRFQMIMESHLAFKTNFRTIIGAREEFKDKNIGIPIVGKDKPE